MMDKIGIDTEYKPLNPGREIEMNTSTEQEQSFYDNRFQKEEEKFMDWCDKCQKQTQHTEVAGSNGLESYSYCVCSSCGNKY